MLFHPTNMCLHRYKKNISVAKQACYLVLYWLIVIVAVLPLAIGLIESWPFPDRYSCQVKIHKSRYRKNNTKCFVYCIS